MSKQANPRLIGLFVIGAMALIIVGVMVFGGGSFFKHGVSYVMYFKGSVIGLDIGAPVTFRGVKVGSVSSISLEFDQSSGNVTIPVVVRFEPDRVKGQLGDGIEDAYEGVKNMVERGMRAELAMQSLLTGKLYIELEVYPEADPAQVEEGGEYPEIPTISSELDRLLSTIKKLPIQSLADKTLSAVEGIEKILNAPEMMGTIRSLGEAAKQFPQLATELKGTITEIQTLVSNVNTQIQPIASDYQGVASDARQAIRDINAHVTPLLATLTETTAVAQKTLEETQKTIIASGKVVDSNSQLIFETQRTLKQLASAARSVRNLTDYLERHPDSLLRGKQR